MQQDSVRLPGTRLSVNEKYIDSILESLDPRLSNGPNASLLTDAAVAGIHMDRP